MASPNSLQTLSWGVLTLLILCSAKPGFGEADPQGRRLEYDLRGKAAASGCEVALPEIERARAAHPDSASLARLSGECRIQRFDYEGAAKALSDSARLAPDADNTQLYLAIARYHLEEFPAAWEALEAAEGHYRASAAPQFELYRGLLLLQRGEHADAAAALERATEASPGEVEPVASYYAGLSFLGLRDRKQARAALERVAAMDPDGEWGLQAREALDSVALEERNWLGVQAGLEYDSNVVLLGDGIPLAGDISGESDGRAVWFLEGGFEFFEVGSWSGGLIANYAGSANFDLTQFDVEYPSVGGWVDRWVGQRSLLRFRYSFGHAWVDYDSFVFSQNAVLTGYHDWQGWGRTELAVAWEWNDYKYDIPFVPSADPGTGNCPAGYQNCAPEGFDSQAARERDGNGLNLGLTHRYLFDTGGLAVLSELRGRGGFGYREYWSEGSDWDYSGYRFSLGFDVELPWKLELDAEGSWEYMPFAHPSSYPTPPLPGNSEPYTLPTEDRLDEVGRFSTAVSRPITRRIEASARYYYIRNDSNVAVFDYHRHIVGAYLSFDL
ncbi:MAG: tetratricopeptide repeat protein [Myxococcota bacterium]